MMITIQSLKLDLKNFVWRQNANTATNSHEIYLHCYNYEHGNVAKSLRHTCFVWCGHE